MGVLHELTSDLIPFRWTYTYQRAFEDVKRLATVCWDHHRKPLNYDPSTLPINVVTDGCGTGIAGVVSQGKNWKTADVAIFYSIKLNSAQQNYSIHEIEMLASVKTMLRHHDILQGVKFHWFTDHKGLVHLLKQKNLSRRQARCLEKISEFDFEVIYVPSSDNVLSDALLRLYAYDKPGTVHAHNEHIYLDVADNGRLKTHSISMPLLVGLEGASINLGDTVETGNEDNVRDLEGVFCSGPSISRNYYGIVELDVMNRPGTPCGFALYSPQQRKEGESALTPSTTSSTNSQPNERLTDMPSGSGTPQDPLNYAGHLNLSEELNPDHSPSTSSNHPLLDTLSLTVITIPYHAHSTDDRLSLPPNICLTSNQGHHLLFSDKRKDLFTLEAAHLDSYVAFGCHVCRSPKFQGPAPFMYGYFADLWNDTNHPCGFLLQNADGIWAPEGDPIPHDLFMAIYHDPCHDSLHKAKVIHKDDSMNDGLLASWKTTASICIKCQLHDQEQIQRQQDTRRIKKQATIHGTRLVEAQEHAAESCYTRSEHEAYKQRINNAKCNDVELDVSLSTFHSHCEPAIAITTFPLL